MAKQVFCIFTCDEWRSKDSMRLYAVCTTPNHVRRIIADGIKKELFLYGNAVEESFIKQSKRFREAWDKAVERQGLDGTKYVLDLVSYCHVESVTTNTTI